jgi:hypothetical protein
MALNLQYVCKNCNKGYQRYGYYSKHIVQCQPIDFTLYRPVNLDSIKTPSQCQQMLEYCLSRMDEFQHKIKEMEKEKQIDKKKIDILSWLNKNYKPETCYKGYIDNITLDIKYIQLLQENNLLTVIDEIFNNCFTKTDNSTSFKAFTVKLNIIYVYTENSWKIFSHNDTKYLISKLIKNFRELLQIWYENNKAIIEYNLSDTYLKLIKKVNSIDINNQNFINKIYKQLYDYLKIDIKIIEYIFT